jgi:hypothetical protein
MFFSRSFGSKNSMLVSFGFFFFAFYFWRLFLLVGSSTAGFIDC